MADPIGPDASTHSAQKKGDQIGADPGGSAGSQNHAGIPMGKRLAMGYVPPVEGKKTPA
jgi:hypothetical protein